MATLTITQPQDVRHVVSAALDLDDFMVSIRVRSGGCWRTVLSQLCDIVDELDKCTAPQSAHVGEIGAGNGPSLPRLSSANPFLLETPAGHTNPFHANNVNPIDVGHEKIQRSSNSHFQDLSFRASIPARQASAVTVVSTPPRTYASSPDYFQDALGPGSHDNPPPYCTTRSLHNHLPSGGVNDWSTPQRSHSDTAKSTRGGMYGRASTPHSPFVSSESTKVSASPLPNRGGVPTTPARPASPEFPFPPPSTSGSSRSSKPHTQAYSPDNAFQPRKFRRAASSIIATPTTAKAIPPPGFMSDVAPLPDFNKQMGRGSDAVDGLGKQFERFGF
ncbi:hypothetical protein QBC47DRAFT_441631 [Echria macrotheca]|uniref:Uncharacterized protein n=1 Tax=Echria macrotheca TaxID=438768 RepID=A0AAJ0F125_9PEZI|nr:hypothetical protein QBC47DRAFT_441631 [Echria macrotheca]